MIEVVQTGEVESSLQKRMLPMSFVESALLCVVNLINQDMEGLKESERFLEENPEEEQEEVAEQTTEVPTEESTVEGNTVEEKEPETEPTDPEPQPEKTPEDIQKEKESKYEKYKQRKIRFMHIKNVENYYNDLITLKHVLGFSNLDGTDPENKEDTLVRAWSTILQWRKGRTLVQRSILALSKTLETENAIIALTFICRCMRVLMSAENSEKAQLHINYQQHYRSTLLQSFHEVSKGINILPPHASYEAVLELLGLTEHRGQLKKIDPGLGMDIIEVLSDRFTLSLFGTFVKRIIEACQRQSDIGTMEEMTPEITKSIKTNLAYKNSILKYLNNSLGDLTAFQKEGLEVAKPLVKFEFLDEIFEKFKVKRQ